MLHQAKLPPQYHAIIPDWAGIDQNPVRPPLVKPPRGMHRASGGVGAIGLASLQPFRSGEEGRSISLQT